MSDTPLHVERAFDKGYLNLRCSPANSDALTYVKDKFGVALPVSANSVKGTDRRAYWLGPDEWLLESKGDDIAECRKALEDGLLGHHAAINDLSGALVTYRVRGRRSRKLLAKGCTLDLHPDVFKAGACAQTGLAKANVILRVADDGDGFDVIVRRSFADYVWQWLSHAGRNLGIEVA